MDVGTLTVHDEGKTTRVYKIEGIDRIFRKKVCVVSRNMYVPATRIPEVADSREAATLLALLAQDMRICRVIIVGPAQFSVRRYAKADSFKLHQTVWRFIQQAFGWTGVQITYHAIIQVAETQSAR